MKNRKVLLIARFSFQNFKVSVELWKSYIVTLQKTPQTWTLYFCEMKRHQIPPPGICIDTCSSSLHIRGKSQEVVYVWYKNAESNVGLLHLCPRLCELRTTRTNMRNHQSRFLFLAISMLIYAQVNSVFLIFHFTYSTTIYLISARNDGSINYQLMKLSNITRE